MARLVLINGLPGVGKSTVARLLADATQLALSLDIDQIKHALGLWETAIDAAGLQARRLALVVAGAHLADGHDVFVGQFLAQGAFIDELAGLSASFSEFILNADESVVVGRLRHRAANPDRPEQVANARHATEADVPELSRLLGRLHAQRPHATIVDASGTPEETAALVRAHLSRAPAVPQTSECDAR